jgi:hypothetical protein
MNPVSIEKFVQKKVLGIFDFLERYGQIKKSVMLLPVMAVLVSLFSAFPSYDIANKPEMSENWVAILNQVQDPFKANQYFEGSHAANLSFRLTPVLLARILRVETINGFLILQFASFLLFMVVVAKAFQRITADFVVQALLTFGLSLTFAGNVLCSDYRGMFDVLSFLFLTVAITFNNSMIIYGSLLLAFFTDERALIASGLVYVFFIVERSPAISAIHVKSFFLFHQAKLLAITGSWITYLVLRLILSNYFGLSTNSAGMINYLFSETINQINIFPLALWTGLEGFWLMIILSLVIIFQHNNRLLFFAYSLCLAAVSFVAIWVFDITRSMAYLLPSVFIGLLLLQKTQSKISIRYFSFFVLVLCVFPTYYAGGPNMVNWLYPLPMQIIRILLM